jgi:hypothetical protein
MHWLRDNRRFPCWNSLYLIDSVDRPMKANNYSGLLSTEPSFINHPRPVYIHAQPLETPPPLQIPPDISKSPRPQEMSARIHHFSRPFINPLEHLQWSPVYRRPTFSTVHFSLSCCEYLGWDDRDLIFLSVVFNELRVIWQHHMHVHFR